MLVAKVDHLVDHQAILTLGCMSADMKSSVSFEAARRALIEAKSHAKSKAAAVLQANNKAWQDKLTAAKGEQQQLMQQVEELTQQRDRLLTQVC